MAESGVTLSAELRSLLAESFAPLAKHSPELPGRVLRYVIEGSGEDVLGDLSLGKDAKEVLKAAMASGKGFDVSELGDAGQLLGLNSIHPRGTQAEASLTAKFLREVETRDAALLVRLARVYEACARQRRALFMNESMFGDLAFEWLDVFLWEACKVPTGARDHSQAQRCRSLDAPLIEAMLARSGQPVDALVKALLLQQAEIQRPGGRVQSAWWGPGHLKKNIAWLPGIGESFTRHKAPVVAALRSKTRETREHAVQVLEKLKVPLGPFAGEIAELAVAGGKQVRQSVSGLVKRVGAEAAPFLQEKATSGSKAERLAAIQLLREIPGVDAGEFFRQRLEQERAEEVAAALREAAGAGAKPAQAAPSAALALPPVAPVKLDAPLDRETGEAFHKCCEAINEAGRQDGGRISEELAGQAFVKLQALVLSAAERAPKPRHKHDVLLRIDDYRDRVWRPVKDFLARPDLEPIHLVRLLYLTGELVPGGDEAGSWFGYRFDELVAAYRRTHRMELRDLAAAMDAFGLDGGKLGEFRLTAPRWRPTALTWEAAAIWPYFAEHLDQIERALNSTATFYAKDYRRAAFGVLALFPQPPERFARVLWDMALGPKTERALAQPCLEGAPDKIEKLLAALGAGKADVRAAAAEWLGRLHDPAAVQPLLAALKKEKQDAARGALMLALELLGVPVDQFLDREGLAKEAGKILAGGIPSELKWLPGPLPSVHWADSGQLVAPAIVQAWLVSCWKNKSPEPSTMLRRYCAALEPEERAALGQYLFDAWMAEDLDPISPADAEKRARARAKAQVQFAKLFAGQNPAPAKTEEEYYQGALPELLREPRGTAVASKGVLALAAACGGAGAAPAIGRYLKEWYGRRAAQCRALLQALAWVEHPSAVQMLFAVGRRFRTKSIQEEANKQVQALAERKGWSVMELADHTVPTAGLEENGRLALDYGGRELSARLNDELDLALFDENDKPLKSLPEPRKDDDPAKAEAAKKQLAAAKKELKAALTMQRERLYEAMCTERAWRFDDWTAYLHQHPILGRYCQKLVWAVFRQNKLAWSFRPLSDGSLTDAADEPVTVEPGDVVKLAHECLMAPKQAADWGKHLRDYEVEPLFEQFGKPAFTLAEERRLETEITDCEGHVVEAFKLRSRATKLGYARGETQDGGYFCEYRKRLPALGTDAVITFTGNQLPEQNRPVALVSLHFERVPDGQAAPGGGSRLSLGEVPAVFLTECWHDLRSTAALGSGFDPNWQKKLES